MQLRSKDGEMLVRRNLRAQARPGHSLLSVLVQGKLGYGVRFLDSATGQHFVLRPVHHGRRAEVAEMFRLCGYWLAVYNVSGEATPRDSHDHLDAL